MERAAQNFPIVPLGYLTSSLEGYIDLGLFDSLGFPLLDHMSSVLIVLLCVSNSHKLPCEHLPLETNLREVEVVIQR